MDLTTPFNVKSFLEVFTVVQEAGTIPAAPGPYTITVDQAATWETYGAVTFTATGATLTRVTTAPAASQYSVASGVYTFNAADAGKGVQITYTYTAAGKWEDLWDTLVSYLIDDISAQAEGYCNRGFEKTSRTEYQDGGGKYLYLKNPPIASITSIKCSPTWDWADTTAEDSSGYALNSVSGMVQYLYANWPYGLGCIQVVYTGGYDLLSATTQTTPLPADLEAAICRQVAYSFNRRKDLGLESITFPDGTIQKKNVDQWLPEVRKVLDRYKMRRVGG